MSDPTEPTRFPYEEFADVLNANKDYAELFDRGDQAGNAARGLAIVTCMDSRIDPLSIVGMDRGDVKILRNAGARVTSDVLRTLVLAAYLLDVRRVLIMPHTDCAMTTRTDADIHALIMAEHGVDTRSLVFSTVPDQDQTLAGDLVRIRSNPYLPPRLVVAGAVYDVHTGRLEPKDY